MRYFILLSLLTGATTMAAVEKTIAFNYKDAPVNKVVEYYSKVTGQRFVIDPNISQTKITIVQPGKVSTEEAFNLLSTSLALSNLAISNHEGTFVIASARQMERNFLPVVTELPAMQPERLVTWVATLKNTSADSVIKQVRIFSSRDGEVMAYGPNNQLLFTDWISNLYRVRGILEQLDKPGKTVSSAAKEKE